MKGKFCKKLKSRVSSFQSTKTKTFVKNGKNFASKGNAKNAKWFPLFAGNPKLNVLFTVGWK